MGATLVVLFVAGLGQAALAGFPRDHSLLGFVALNSAGHVFHLATGVIALIFGLTRPGSDPLQKPHRETIVLKGEGA